MQWYPPPGVGGGEKHTMVAFEAAAERTWKHRHLARCIDSARSRCKRLRPVCLRVLPCSCCYVVLPCSVFVYPDGVLGWSFGPGVNAYTAYPQVRKHCWHVNSQWPFCMPLITILLLPKPILLQFASSLLNTRSWLCVLTMCTACLLHDR